MAIESITGRKHAPVTNITGQKVEIDSGNKASTKQAERADSIAITAMAQGIKKTLESSSFAAIVDVDRVAAVKKALADGSYQINAEKIAEKMIQHEKLMSRHDKTRTW
jgi:negative regulator of flagellin synthesis FlgM